MACIKKRRLSRRRSPFLAAGSGQSQHLSTFNPIRAGRFRIDMIVWAGRPAKLRMRWKGPAMVVRANSPWVFEIQNLITGLVKEAHASRLKFYADKDLEVSADLLAHVAHNDQGYEVEAFGDARWNEVKQVYETAVMWRGLDDAETSWEPAQNLFEDLPGPLAKYLKTRMADSVFHAMCERYGWHLPQGVTVAVKVVTVVRWRGAECLRVKRT
jgi:hypothetical protein